MRPVDSKRHVLKLFEKSCDGESLDRRGGKTNVFRKRRLKSFTDVEKEDDHLGDGGTVIIILNWKLKVRRWEVVSWA